MDKIQAQITYTSAAVVAAGGLYGYLRSGSRPSLAGGLFFGTLLAGAGYLIMSPKYEDRSGHLLAFATSTALAGMMGARCVRVRSFSGPAAMLTAFGVASAAFHGSYLLSRQPFPAFPKF